MFTNLMSFSSIQRQQKQQQVRHLAMLLYGMMEEPGCGANVGR